MEEYIKATLKGDWGYYNRELKKQYKENWKSWGFPELKDQTKANQQSWGIKDFINQNKAQKELKESGKHNNY